MFHRHTWTVLAETEQPSPIEIMKKAGLKRVKGGNPWDFRSLGTRPILVKYHCECSAEKVVRV